jgi:hypothetical protein
LVSVILMPSSLSDLKEIGCKMSWTVQISPIFGAKGTIICSKTVRIYPRPVHFSHRSFKPGRLLVLVTTPGAL